MEFTFLETSGTILNNQSGQVVLGDYKVMKELFLGWENPKFVSTSFLFCNLLVVPDISKMDLFACGPRACCNWVRYDLELETSLLDRILMKVMMYTDI